MYNVYDYGRMIDDRVRMEAYYKALKQTVIPNSVVLDLGTGIGISALLASRLGAQKVYAIEPNNAIVVAQEIAAMNGYGDRIVFLQEFSTRVTLPESVDVIVSDLRGTLPLFQRHLPTLADARKRFLKLGGTIIPQKDMLWAALASSPKRYEKIVGPLNRDFYGFNMQAATRIVTSNYYKASDLPIEQLIVEPQCWATLNYTTLDHSDVSGELTWITEKVGTVHGLCLWFDAVLADGIRFSNAPGEPEAIYGRAFFPWSTPVDLAVGDKITLALQANLVGDDYIWRWDTKVFASGTEHLKANFKQSTFKSSPISPTQLRKSADKFVPQLNEEGQINHLVLELMKAATPLGRIAQQVSSQFPQRFPKWQHALTRVGELSQKYSA